MSLKGLELRRHQLLGDPLVGSSVMRIARPCDARTALLENYRSYVLPIQHGSQRPQSHLVCLHLHGASSPDVRRQRAHCAGCCAYRAVDRTLTTTNRQLLTCQRSLHGARNLLHPQMFYDGRQSTTVCASSYCSVQRMQRNCKAM